ncbi:MAG: CDC24 calponin-domain-containing protein [Linnemannia elongata]|nr:MAG: CDC24 calponin-domain-containing protein [Linnemannia elongata]
MSLYQSCLNLIERLAGVPDFEQYLDQDLLHHLQADSAWGASTPNDPVTQLWILFRLGTPLACILNGLRPHQQFNLQSTELSLANVNGCKEFVFHFIVACLQDFKFEKENVFTISELYHDNTNGFVKTGIEKWEVERKKQQWKAYFGDHPQVQQLECTLGEWDFWE